MTSDEPKSAYYPNYENSIFRLKLAKANYDEAVATVICAIAENDPPEEIETYNGKLNLALASLKAAVHEKIKWDEFFKDDENINSLAGETRVIEMELLEK